MISKDYDNAYEILENYIKDNVMMKECKDIYYSKIYIDLEKLFATFKQKTYTNIIDELSKQKVVKQLLTTIKEKKGKIR